MSQINLSKRGAKVLIRALTKLLEKGPKDPGYGICYNLDNATPYYLRAYDIVGRWSPDWPGVATENLETDDGRAWCGLPIPRTSVRGSLWEGDQLAKRQDLLRYLITRAETYL